MLTTFTRGALAMLTLSLPLPSVAQNVLSGDHSIDGRLCAGPACNNGEIFWFDIPFKIKNDNVGLYFEDVGGAQLADWAIKINDDDVSGGANFFAVEDASNRNQIFRIDDGAPGNSLYVAANGDIGMGTSLPQTPLHVFTDSSSGIRLERSNTFAGSERFEMFIRQSGDFGIYSSEGNATSLVIDTLASSDSLVLREFETTFNNAKLNRSFAVRSQQDTDANKAFFVNGDTGNVGIGNSTPRGALHIRRTNGTAQLLVEDTGTSNGNLSMMHLTNRSGRARMQFTSVGNPNQTGDWSISSGLTFVLQERLTGSNVFIMDNQGNLRIKGELTTTGSCSVGCDRVFDEDYDLPSIAEHQSAMWTNGYLPNVGPTPEDGPFNVSDKMGRMLNELEHAHIFIGQQQSQIEALDAELSTLAQQNALRDRQIDALMARLAVLEK